MKLILGNLFKGIGKFIEVLTNGIIYILYVIVTLIDSFKKLLGVFSIFFIFFLLNPFLLYPLLLNPRITTALIILFVVPLLGKGLISYLRYLQFILTEFFYDRSDYYLLGKGRKSSLGDYGREYVRRKREQEQRESEERARQQQRMWEEMFRQYYEQMGRGGYTTYGGRTTYERDPYGSTGYGNQGNIYNPTGDFIAKYEESCRTLGLPPTTDKYEIKLAFRKLAKQYHPDVNKSPDATEKFQKINDANEFLSDANIERYEQLKKQAN